MLCGSHSPQGWVLAPVSGPRSSASAKSPERCPVGPENLNCLGSESVAAAAEGWTEFLVLSEKEITGETCGLR